MNEQKLSGLKEFEVACEEILKLVIVDNSFQKQWKKVVEFLENYTTFCAQSIIESHLKSSLFILIKLQSVCAEVLKTFPAEADPKREISYYFQAKEKDTQRDNRIDIGNIIRLLQNAHNSKDITELKNPAAFAYYLVLEYFLQITNNIAYISFKRNKLDKAIHFLLRAIDVFELTRYSSFYVKYHLSTVIINLIFLVDENNPEDSSQVITNVILYLEKMETEIDKHKNKEAIYNYINERAFSFSFMIEPKNPSLQEKEFKNKKSFILARMCIAYGYYAELLDVIGKKKESGFAKKQAEFLEKELDKREINLNPPTSTDKNRLTRENLKNIGGNYGTPTTTQHQHFDTQSSASFQTAGTGQTGLTNTFIETNKIRKEDILFQKYVEVNDIKFKILMVHMPDLNCLQIIVYSKPRNLLKKIFLHFQEILSYAKKHDIALASEKDVNKVLTKVAKLLYFKEGELFLKEIPYFRTLEDLSRVTML